MTQRRMEPEQKFSSESGMQLPQVDVYKLETKFANGYHFTVVCVIVFSVTLGAMDHRVVLILFLLLFTVQSSPFEKSSTDLTRRLPRRFDCTSFCRTTGYEGVIGGCRCGYVLFVKRKSPATLAAGRESDKD